MRISLLLWPICSHLLPFINFGTIFKLTPVSLLLLCAYLLLWQKWMASAIICCASSSPCQWCCMPLLKDAPTDVFFILCWLSLFHAYYDRFFIPFLFIRLGKKASFRFYIYIVLGFGLLYILFTNLSIFSSSSFYAFQRLATASNAYALKDIIQPSAVYPFLAVTVILYVKAFFFDSERRKCELYINNLFLILISMCLLMTSMPLMQTRYFIIRFFSCR